MEKASPPRVWIMTAEYEPLIIGGLGTVATELTKALNALHVNMNIVTASQTRRIQINHRNITLLRIPKTSPYYKNKSYKSKHVRRLIARYLQHRPDLIHVHSLEFAKAALALKRKYRIPVCYTCHSLASMESKKRSHGVKLQELLLRGADRIIVPSHWLKQQIRRRYAKVSSKINVIPNGVTTISTGSKAPAYKLLFVGRIIRDKGIEALIGALPYLSRKNRRVQLTIVGKGSHKYQKRLKSIAKKRGVASRIRWMGPLPHSKVQRLYSSYGAVVVPSKRESFCLVALEAMANRVPLVSSRAGGLREFVNKNNAQIIRNVNSRTIGRAIYKMWKHPKKIRRRVANAKLVASRYHWRNIAIRYKRLFVSVSGRRGKNH